MISAWPLLVNGNMDATQSVFFKALRHEKLPLDQIPFKLYDSSQANPIQ